MQGRAIEFYSLMNLDPPRDRFEFWVRFAFGAVFGLLLALMLGCWVLPNIAATWLVALGAAVLFGAAAALWGDGFWRFLFGLFRWW
jgi:hypothetical protein